MDSANIETKTFKFTGKGREFFAIWIVNVALTILTIGIYSAWAKVRTHQYFYSNTMLDGASFRYTAKPLQILKGRLIAFVVFMAYYISSSMSPVLAISALIILMLLVPAFMVLSMSFRLRNSMYRNVSFMFDKDFAQAYKVFSIPVVIIGLYIFFAGQLGSMQEDQVDKMFLPTAVSILALSMALMFPWWEYMITRFKVVNAKFGDSSLMFSATNKNYYGMYFKMYGLLLLIIFVVIAFFKAITMADLPIMQILLVFLLFPIYLWIFAYLQAKRTNLVYGNIYIGGHKIKSDLKVGYLLYLYITNTLAMMMTLGLLMPWAKVRTAKYRASVTSIDVEGSLDNFVSINEKKQNALAEEMGEMFDLDLGF